MHLFDFIRELIDSDNNNLINKYFKDFNKNEFDNVSDINRKINSIIVHIHILILRSS